MPKTIIAVDSTKVNVLQLCARRFAWTFRDALSPLAKPDYFERGDLIHKMLAPYYNMRRGRSRWTQNKHEHSDIVRICMRIGEHFAVGMQLPIDEVQQIMFQFGEYCKYYEHDGWDRILAVEQVGSFVLYEDDEICIIYEIKPDLVLQLDNGIIMPVDHKTAKQRRESSGLANQFMSYCYGLHCNNININKIGFQTTLPPKDRFQRTTICYPDDVLLEWKENTIWWVKQLLQHIEADYWPANFTSCDKYAGCIFRAVCIKERIAREFALKRSFETSEVWDVGRGL